ncbi:MAG: hypothetical protein IK128_00260 [Clostridiales bacterium]|nr:hypothetical protein [Clostridiales bacterium]
MYWQQRPHPENWIDQIRYFTDHNNKLTENELRDAFINLAYLYVMEHTNVMLLEDGIMDALGDRGEQFIQLATTQTDRAKELTEIDINDGDLRDILGITLNMLDYIEDTWK